MSGGHYGYFYMKVLDFCERIEEDLEDKEASISDETRELMVRFKAELLHTTKRAKALEWLMSGDSGEEYFKKFMEEPFNPEITVDDVWGCR